jgi:hypothetical protein
MTHTPIAALIARDAVERQFRPSTPTRPEELQAEPAAGPTRPTWRAPAARALRRLADRLEPRPLRPQAARQAHPAGHRGSPC